MGNAQHTPCIIQCAQYGTTYNEIYGYSKSGISLHLDKFGVQASPITYRNRRGTKTYVGCTLLPTKSTRTHTVTKNTPFLHKRQTISRERASIDDNF